MLLSWIWSVGRKESPGWWFLTFLKINSSSQRTVALGVSIMFNSVRLKCSWVQRLVSEIIFYSDLLPPKENQKGFRLGTSIGRSEFKKKIVKTDVKKLFILESECACEQGKGQRERNRLPTECGAQCGVWSQDPEIMTRTEGRCLPTEPPRDCHWPLFVSPSFVASANTSSWGVQDDYTYFMSFLRFSDTTGSHFCSPHKIRLPFVKTLLSYIWPFVCELWPKFLREVYQDI